MKYWALLVAALYVLILAALTLPVLAAAFAPDFGWANVRWPTANDLRDLWPYWVWLLVMALSQFALLAVPVRLAGRRPVARGPLLPTILAAGLMAGGMVIGCIRPTVRTATCRTSERPSTMPVTARPDRWAEEFPCGRSVPGFPAPPHPRLRRCRR